MLDQFVGKLEHPVLDLLHRPVDLPHKERDGPPGNCLDGTLDHQLGLELTRCELGGFRLEEFPDFVDLICVHLPGRVRSALFWVLNQCIRSVLSMSGKVRPNERHTSVQPGHIHYTMSPSMESFVVRGRHFPAEARRELALARCRGNALEERRPLRPFSRRSPPASTGVIHVIGRVPESPDMLGPFGSGASTSLGDAAALAPGTGYPPKRPWCRPRAGACHRAAARFLPALAVITGIFLLAADSNLVLLLLNVRSRARPRPARRRHHRPARGSKTPGHAEHAAAPAPARPAGCSVREVPATVEATLLVRWRPER